MGELSFGVDNSLFARNYELGDDYIARNQDFIAILLSINDPANIRSTTRQLQLAQKRHF